MNAEEKQAIQELKVLIGLAEYNKLSYKENQSINIALNLIEKQQKEIERIEKKLKRYQKYLRDSEKKCDKLLELEYTERERDYISKDKIKEKIEELENLKEQITTNECMRELSASVEILKELLGE